MQYVEPIEEASKKLEELNDKRDVMVNRLKLVEGEKDALAIVKAEAEAFLEKEKELLFTRSTMYQLFIQETQKNLATIQENKDAHAKARRGAHETDSSTRDALEFMGEGRKGELPESYPGFQLRTTRASKILLISNVKMSNIVKT